MKKTFRKNLLISATGVVVALGLVAAPAASAFAQSTSTASTTSQTASNQKTLAQVIAEGNADISMRLTTLSNLVGVVNSTTKLSSADRAYLLAEVNGELSGLSALKTKLDAETSVSAAKTDVANIFLQFRVYALVAPKVTLVKAADGQQTTEGDLTTLAAQLQTRINDEKNANVNVSQLQTWLNEMEADTTNAQNISSSIEQKVLPLQPSDYDANHAILSGDYNDLKQSSSDNQASYGYAKEIVTVLDSM
jgi:hypothetical protein